MMITIDDLPNMAQNRVRMLCFEWGGEVPGHRFGGLSDGTPAVTVTTDELMNLAARAYELGQQDTV